MITEVILVKCLDTTAAHYFMMKMYLLCTS